MDVKFNPYELTEELLEEKSIVLQEKILVQDENAPILGFDDARENLTMDESSLKFPFK